MTDDKNEITEMWREIHKETQNRHQASKEVNLNILAKSGISFRKINNNECCLFREYGKPQVDFYPSTGRWKKIVKDSAPEYFEGGATSFVNWYRKQ